MFALPHWLLLIITVSTGTFYNICRGAYAKSGKSTARRLWFFNLVMSSFTTLCIIVLEWISGSSFAFSRFTVLAGVCFGLCLVTSSVSSLKAQTIGPFIYTCVIVALSSIIPTLSGRLWFGETVFPMQYVGIGLMVLCIILSPERGTDDGKRVGLVWLIFCAVAFFFSGGIGLMQKVHQESDHRAEMPALLIIGFLISALFSAVMYLVQVRREKAAGLDSPPTKKDWLMATFSGLTIAFPHVINLYLSGVMDAVVFFPIVNIGPMLLAVLYAVTVFRERLSVRRWVGVAIGIASTLFVGGIVDKLLR